MRWFLVLAALLLIVGASNAYADYIDTTGPTGEYYQYSSFDSSTTAFRGGGDVDSYGNYIYVNRDGLNLDRYTVSVSGTAYDQHPDNPSATGSILARTLTYDTTYTVSALDTPTIGEIYATATGVYFLSQGNAGISFYNFSTGSTSSVVSSPGVNLSHLGYDDVNSTWFGMNESSRTVYSWNGSSWQSEFSWSSLAGGHPDGLEVVTAADGTPYVYVSDMTSDYLGQWRYDSTTSAWVEENLFEYDGTAGAAVEGLGFGALGHFWITTGFTNSGTLYEIGGGDLGGYTPPAIPEPGTLVLVSLGVAGLVTKRRRRRRS